MNDIPPVAKGVICVDFDGTIFQWGDRYDKTPPFVGAIDTIRAFRDAGYTIVIFTSRMSPTWWASEDMDMKQAYITQMTFCQQRLDNFGIPYDRITAEKVPAEYYIDDKAVEFEGNDYSWQEIRKRVLG